LNVGYAPAEVTTAWPGSTVMRTASPSRASMPLSTATLSGAMP
jgi:hypothetical protein